MQPDTVRLRNGCTRRSSRSPRRTSSWATARAPLLATSGVDAAREHGLPALLEEGRFVEAALWSSGNRAARVRRKAGPG
jgi:hypothetical protein